MKEVIILDASILKDIFSSFSTKGLSKKLEKIFEKNDKNFIVLDIILNELSSNLFQKKINYDNYDNWFKLRMSSYEKLYAFFIRKKIELEYLDDNFSNNLSLFKVANTILGESRIIRKFIKENDLKYRLDKRKEMFTFSFFTYTSSILLAYVILYARNNKDKKVIFLVTNPFLYQIQRYFVQDSININWPSNLKIEKF
jgi:ABC-type multidrug transport system fused ATPase/permease subunit